MTKRLSKQDILNQRTEYTAICGIYFLIAGDEIVYVGQARNIFFRLAAHYNSDKVFQTFSYVECAPEELCELEAEYIVAFAPRYNITLPPNQTWTSMALLRRRATELGINFPKIKRYMSEHKIKDTNGYYLISDFRELLGDEP
jgi:excinuclease UvrABC nuclease subunit